MKYKAGDPVWARRNNYRPGQPPPGEYPAIVIGLWKETAKGPVYQLDSLGLLVVPPRTVVTCRKDFLRPRRDDYQQREGLGSRDQLTNPLAPSINEAELERICESITESV